MLWRTGQWNWIVNKAIRNVRIDDKRWIPRISTTFCPNKLKRAQTTRRCWSWRSPNALRFVALSWLGFLVVLVVIFFIARCGRLRVFIDASLWQTSRIAVVLADDFRIANIFSTWSVLRVRIRLTEVFAARTWIAEVRSVRVFRVWPLTTIYPKAVRNFRVKSRRFESDVCVRCNRRSSKAKYSLDKFHFSRAFKVCVQ